MMEVFPVVNSRDRDEVARKTGLAESLMPAGAEWVHLDIADGRFTYHKTWDAPQEWSSQLKLEVHLMVERPEEEIGKWLEAGAKRVIVHYESLFGPALRPHPVDGMMLFGELADKCEAARAALVVSVNPETPAEVLVPLAERTRNFQILAVTPGLAGQQFKTTVLEKIKFLRARFPDATIQVDGGMTPETAKLVREAGANVITSDSYISNHPDPRKAFRELSNL